MTIEALLTAVIAALEANTAALNGKAAAAPAAAGTAKAGTTKPAAKPAAPKGPSRDEMVAVITEVKEKLGSAAAKEIIADTGVTKMAEIPDAKIKSAFDAATALLNAPADAADPEDDGL